MEVVQLDAVFGNKYVAVIQGKVREVFLLKVTQDEERPEVPQLVLEAAGLGRVRVDIDTCMCLERPGEVDERQSILAENYADFREGKFIKYKILIDTHEPCFQYLKRLLPNFNFDDCGGTYAYVWNDEKLVAERREMPWKYWEFSADGFITDLPRNGTYPTKEDCLKAHEDDLNLVTF